jgi:hypothetical protein
MTGISPAASASATHLHVYLHVTARPSAELSLESEVQRLVGSGIGFGLVGQIGGPRDYVPMSLNVPFNASKQISDAFNAVVTDTRNREAFRALHAAVSRYIMDATGTDLVLTVQHFLPGTAITKTDDHTLSSR